MVDDAIVNLATSGLVADGASGNLATSHVVADGAIGADNGAATSGTVVWASDVVSFTLKGAGVDVNRRVAIRR